MRKTQGRDIKVGGKSKADGPRDHVDLPSKIHRNCMISAARVVETWSVDDVQQDRKGSKTGKSK